MVLEDRHLFLFGVFEFPRRGLEIFTRPARDDLHIGGADALGGAATIHGGVPHANDDHALADFLDVLEVHVGEPLDANVDVRHDAFVPTTVDVEFLALRRTAPHVHRVIALGEQRFHRRDFGAVLHGGTHVDDVAALVVEHFCRQTEARNVHAHQPAGLRVLLVDSDVVAKRQQVVGHGERARPRANKRHALAVLHGRRGRELIGDVVPQIGGHALEAADGDRLAVHAAAAAGRLAGAIARASENTREHV